MTALKKKPIRKSGLRIDEAEYTKTASDYRRTKAPRGALRPAVIEAYRLHYGEKLSRDEVAKRMGITRSTLERWLFEARAELAGK